MFLACEPMAYHICSKTMLSYPYVKMPMNECCLTVLTVENTFPFAIENQKLNVNCSLVQNIGRLCDGKCIYSFSKHKIIGVVNINIFCVVIYFCFV